MARKTYYEMLKDPRWQKKRLEIMERDEFCCNACGSMDSTLNIHHAFYIKNRAPWEYSDKMLFTLCEDCHKNIQNNVKKVSYLTSRAGEFSWISTTHYKDLINLYLPSISNKHKFKSLSNILINAFFCPNGKKIEKIIIAFLETMHKELGGD